MNLEGFIYSIINCKWKIN